MKWEYKVYSKSMPNAETVEAINDARAKKGSKAENVDDLFKRLHA